MNIPEFGIYEYPDPRHNICSALINNEQTYYVDSFNRKPVFDEISEFYKYFKEQTLNGNFIKLDEKSYGYALTLAWDLYYSCRELSVDIDGSNRDKRLKNIVGGGSFGYVYDKNTVCYNSNIGNTITLNEAKKCYNIILRYNCIPVIASCISALFNDPIIVLNHKKYYRYYNRMYGFNSGFYLEESIKDSDITMQILHCFDGNAHAGILRVKDGLILVIDENYEINILKNNSYIKQLQRIENIKNGHKELKLEVNIQADNLGFNSPLIKLKKFECDIKYGVTKFLKNAPTLLDYDGNPITLKCPVIVEGDFIAKNLHISSLKGCPKIVNGNFIVNNNNLKSFEGLPEHIGGYLDISHNEFTDTAWEYAKENMTIDFNGYRMHHNMFNKYRKELY